MRHRIHACHPSHPKRHPCPLRKHKTRFGAGLWEGGELRWWRPGVQGGYSRDATGTDWKEQGSWRGDGISVAQPRGVAGKGAGLLVVDDRRYMEWETVG
jgi:hypothetical protein